MSRVSFSCLALMFAIAVFAPRTNAQQTGDPIGTRGPGAIVGTVRDGTTGAPLERVAVMVLGPQQLSAETNAAGRYVLVNVPAGTHRLRVRLLGYAPVDTSIVVADGQQAVVDFQLGVSAILLEGIVAVGYGTQRQRDVTGVVSSITTEELEKVQVPTIAQALQGRIAGVTVTQNSSAPGGGVSIRIRGSGSLGTTNEPLYVIDGVPISGGDNNNPTNSRSRGGTVNPLSFLSPEDIESIEVLKDASATAIYGARGTNGVVLITTRRGRPGSSRIQVESSFGVQTVTKKLPVLNGRQFAEFANEWARLQGRGPIPYPDLDNLPAGIDYQDLIYRHAPMHEHNVSVLGGTDRTSFALSGNFQDQKGVVVGSSFRRYSLRANVQHEARRGITLGSNLNISRLNPELGFTDAAQARAAASAVNAATAFIPFMPIYNADGEYTWMDRDFLPELARLGVNGTNYENPMAIIREGFDEAEYDRILGNAFAELTLLPGLRLRLNGGADIVNNSRNEYFTSRSRRGGQANHGLADIGVIEQSHYVAESVMNYAGDIGTLHRFDLTAVAAYERDNQFSRRLENRNFPNDITMFYDVGAGTPQGGPSVGSSWEDWTLLSYVGRFNYALADRYLFTLTGRADGSSKFGSENKWGYFPSVAFAWRASEEPFVQNLGLGVDNLKLRVSYGITGNQEIGTYASLSRMAGRNYNFNGVLHSGFVPNNVANPELRWEKSQQFNAGLDAAFLNNRIALTFDIYRKVTDDLLLSVPLPLESGFTSALQNLGSVQNHGFELALRLDLLDAAGGGLGWNTSMNLSRNRNRVLEVGEAGQFFGGDISGDMKVGGLLVREGLPMGVFYGYQTDGILRNEAEAVEYSSLLPGAIPGQVRIVDVNGDGKLSAADRTVLGNPEPDFSIGWSNDFTFGPFGLYAFLQGTFGNEIYNLNLQELSSGGIGRNFWAPAWENRWTPENPNGTWPAITRAPNTGYSFGTDGETFDRFIEDGSYVRLRNLSLTYEIPQALAARIGGMESARIFVSGENLFTITSYSGFNPDVNSTGQNNINRGIDLGAYPLARTVRAGVRLGF